MVLEEREDSVIDTYIIYLKYPKHGRDTLVEGWVRRAIVPQVLCTMGHGGEGLRDSEAGSSTWLGSRTFRLSKSVVCLYVVRA
jgi:hypothetical protein